MKTLLGAIFLSTLLIGCGAYPDLEMRFEKLIALHKKNAHKYQGQKFNPVFITG